DRGRHRGRHAARPTGTCPRRGDPTLREPPGSTPSSSGRPRRALRRAPPGARVKRRAGGAALRRRLPPRVGARRLAWVACVALLLVVPVTWGAKEVPFLAARVNDLAGLLQAADKERLETKLADLERKTGAQVALLTVDSLDGDTVEDYAVRVFQTWKLG